MDWRAARDGVRLFAIANAVYAVVGIAVSVLATIDPSPTSTAGKLAFFFRIAAAACFFLQVVAAIAIARMPRETPGRGAAIAWAVVWTGLYALSLGGPFIVALAPGSRSAMATVVTSAWLAEAWLFLVVAVAVTRSSGTLFWLTLGAIVVRVGTLAVASFVDAAALRTLAPALAYALLIATRLAWARRIAGVIPPREGDRITLDAKSRDIARHTLALFRRGFTAKLAGAFTLGFAIVLSASFGAYRAAAGLAIAFTLALLATSAILLIALGGWAVVGGRLGRLAGWLAAVDFAASLGWIAIAIFGIELGELAGLLARAATGVVGAAAPLALALSIARIAETEPLAKDARGVAWTIVAFVLAAAAMIALIVAPIRPRTSLVGVVFTTVLSTLPSIALGTSALVVFYLLSLVRSAERAIDTR